MSRITSMLLAAALPLGGGGDPQVAFTLKDDRISESSGLAASTLHPGIVYTHNDSGHAAEIFAVDSATGRTVAVLTLQGLTARDWEGIALGKDERGRPAIYVGDIGDNLHGAWDHVAVFRIREPEVLKSATLPVTAFRFKYQDGPRDAESLLIDPRDNRLYVASKLFGSGKLYEAPKKLSTTGMNILKPVGGAHSFATDGAFAPDGSSFVIRGYFSATIYSAPGEKIDSISLPNQEQGEGITYAADGRSFLISSEGDDRKVWRVPVPQEVLDRSAAADAAAHPDAVPKSGSGNKDSSGTNKNVGLFVLAGVAVAAFAFSRRRK